MNGPHDSRVNVPTPPERYELRTRLASEEINLHAFSAVPLGPNVGGKGVALSSRGTHIELTILSDRFENLLRVAEEFGWTLIGPQHACVIQRDDDLGALAEIQRKLLDAGVKTYPCNELLGGISLLPLICVSFQLFVGFTFDFLPPKSARHQVVGKRIQNVMEVIAFLM